LNLKEDKVINVGYCIASISTIIISDALEEKLALPTKTRLLNLIHEISVGMDGFIHPLTTIRMRSARSPPRDYSSLIDIIYSRIQYLLPWALFGVSELLAYEARKRNVFFGS
jgi:hypothetical protein